MSLRKISLVEGLPFKVPPIEDITDELPKKQSWETLPNKKNVVRGKWDGTYHSGLRNPEDIDTIVIHHSGPPEAPLVNHANNHAKRWGAGIGYHIGIDDGRIKQVNDLLSFTFHVSNHNTYTVGIEINRDLSKGEMTSQERELLYAAILTVKSLLPIQHIVGHNELNATACPCTSMNQIREDIAKLELQMKVAVDPAKIMYKCYRATEQHKYLFNLYQSDREKYDWLEKWLLQLHDYMEEQGMFFGK